MKSRFFYGVFVGFVVASLFFFFFFRVVRAQSPKASPQNHVSAYGRNYGVETSEVQGSRDMATYHAAAYHGAYTSYTDDQPIYGYERARYEGYSQYGNTPAYYERATYNNSHETYNGYQSDVYSVLA